MATRRSECKKCREQNYEVRWKTARKGHFWNCQECGKQVTKILDLHHTSANLCSLECEKVYWFDILY